MLSLQYLSAGSNLTETSLHAARQHGILRSILARATPSLQGLDLYAD